MRIFSDGQFDKQSEWYVFDPERSVFMPIRKFRGNKEKPSDIFLRYVSFETQESDFRNFRMGLFGEKLKPLQHDGKNIEYEGSITRIDCCYNDDYEEKVNFMRKKAAEIYRKQIEARDKGLEFIGDLVA